MVWSNLYVESGKIELLETESGFVIAKESGKWGDVNQRVQTSGYQMTKFWGSKV